MIRKHPECLLENKKAFAEGKDVNFLLDIGIPEAPEISVRYHHMTGDVYPLVESRENDWTKWNGQQIHDPETDCDMVLLFRRKNSPDPDFQLKLSGLMPDAIYEIEFFSGEKEVLSGRKLASLTIHLDRSRSFQIVRYGHVN